MVACLHALISASGRKEVWPVFVRIDPAWIVREAGVNRQHALVSETLCAWEPHPQTNVALGVTNWMRDPSLCCTATASSARVVANALFTEAKLPAFALHTNLHR